MHAQGAGADLQKLGLRFGDRLYGCIDIQVECRLHDRSDAAALRGVRRSEGIYCHLVMSNTSPLVVTALGVGRHHCNDLDYDGKAVQVKVPAVFTQDPPKPQMFALLERVPRLWNETNEVGTQSRLRGRLD